MHQRSGTYRGIVRGRTIELQQEPGLPDGQEVTVTVEPASSKFAPGEGLRRAFGGWADDAEELERFMAWNRRQRKVGRSEPEP